MDDEFSKTVKQEKIKLGKSPFPLALLELLASRTDRMKRKQVNNTIYREPCNSSGGVHKLSTIEIMKIARSSYINRKSDDMSTVINPSDDVELAMFLFASAEKISNLDYYHAKKILSVCFHVASPTGNSVQRLVHYYAVALQERIARQIGIISSESHTNNQKWKLNLDKVITGPTPSAIACRERLPFALVVDTVEVQAILESVTSAKRIHLIDLGIRSGVQWSSLMQALAIREECPIEHLKITVVSTKSKEMIEGTGRRLSSFAQSLSLPFTFNLVMLAEMKELKADLIDLDAKEAVVIHSEMLFMNMIAKPGRLETLIKAIKSLNPVLMVVYETEADTTSPALMDRFIDSLQFYSAKFDSLEDCMDRSDPNRLSLENCFGGGIWDTIALGDEERTIWHIKIDNRRVLFERFGVVETELSMSSLYQAKLVVKYFACGNSCTVDMDGKSLLVGWKGTPLLSVSAWYFRSE